MYLQQAGKQMDKTSFTNVKVSPISSTFSAPGFLSPQLELKFRDNGRKIIHEIVNFHVNILGAGSMDKEYVCLEELLNFNVFNSKTAQWGELSPAALTALKSSPIGDAEETRKHLEYSITVGWITNMFYASHQIACDILNETIESGWHKRPKVGMTAINDSFMLRMMQHNILQLFIAPEDFPLTCKLQDAFRKTNHAILAGVALEEGLKKNNLPGSSSVRAHQQVVKYKFSYPFLFSPVRMAMIVAGRDSDTEFMARLEKIMIDIGYLIWTRHERRVLLQESGLPSRLSWFAAHAMDAYNAMERIDKITKLQDSIKAVSWTDTIQAFNELDLFSVYFVEETRLQTSVVDQAYKLGSNIEMAFFVRIMEKSVI